MKLIVGLGNPGTEYLYTRHNVGFMVVDNYLGDVLWKEKFSSFLYSTEIFSEQVIFLKPTTYMNLSGIAVKKVVDYYKIPIENILVIQDDIDMTLGIYKIKRNSSSGGHNGIKSIIQELGSDEFARLKIGISKSKDIPTDKYVLGKFSTNELEKLKDNEEVFGNIINKFIKYDVEEVMLEFNKH